MKKIKILIALTFLLSLGACAKPIDEIEDTESLLLATVTENLVIESRLISDIYLPLSIDGVIITWESNTANTLSASYEIIQGLTDQDIILTAYLSYDGEINIKTFDVTIVRLGSVDIAIVNNAKSSVSFDSYILTDNIVLPEFSGDVLITWVSNNETHLNNQGTVVRPGEGEDDETVILTATFSYNELVVTQEFTFIVRSTAVSVVYEGYYDGATGLDGQMLKNFLHDLIDGHSVVTYTQLWTYLGYSDEDPINSNNVILFYSGRSQAKNTNGGDPDEWNREHVWARSHGDLEDTIANTDMHHIRPTDVSVNGLRSALDFDEGGNLIFDMGVSTGSYYDSNSFEPRDEVKGDVARIIFYMAVRYDGSDGVPDLEINDSVNNINSNYMGRLSILLEWHFSDLPDEFEMNRNDVIESYQGNRNPFIDHPEFVTSIWGTN